jgi:hypothetical protein
MPQGAGVATGPVKFVVGASRGLSCWTWKTGGRWEIGPFAHTCASVVGVSVGPSVVGHDWSQVSSNKARGCCCRTPGDHRAPLQPRRTARRSLRIRGASPLPPGRACDQAAGASRAAWLYYYCLTEPRPSSIPSSYKSLRSTFVDLYRSPSSIEAES